MYMYSMPTGVARASDSVNTSISMTGINTNEHLHPDRV